MSCFSIHLIKQLFIVFSKILENNYNTKIGCFITILENCYDLGDSSGNRPFSNEEFMRLVKGLM